jgi:hypothetical protein
MNSFWSKALASVRSQWIATSLTFPIIILSITTCMANQQAKEARRQASRIESISEMQESGQVLDAALAGYFNAVAQLGLAEHEIAGPGEYSVVPVSKAREDVMSSRTKVADALIDHAGDIQSLRGTLNQVETNTYVSALADMRRTVDRPAEIEDTGKNIAVLGRLVVARNALVDEALKEAG